VETDDKQPGNPESHSVTQEEMPFAIVQGQPYTQVPKDLYIPPDALEVFLEAFEGPLDLLLYLIRRQNLDILDIPIAEITRQYMSYIGMLDELQFELAAEYLVMASILVFILNLVQGKEENALNKAGQYCLDNLINRLYSP